jgi:ABC-2 type transport system ATP-binding protein
MSHPFGYPSCSPEAPTPAIEIHKLVVRYGRTQAVEELTLCVPTGTVFGLLGPNGAGKTTLIKILLGLRAPTSGRASVLGYDVTQQGPQARAHIGYVSERPSLYPEMTTRQLAAFCRKTSQRWRQDVVDRLVRQFEIPLDTRVGRLSKGMLTQVALCLAMGGDPEVMILDEPTAGLDPLARRMVLSNLVAEAASAEKTIFLSSHILSDIEAVADRVGIIRRGRLLLTDDLDQLRQTHQVLKLTAAAPVAAAEIAQLRQLPAVLDLQHEGRSVRLTIRGAAESILPNIQTIAPSLQNAESAHLSLEDLFMHYIQEGTNAR